MSSSGATKPTPGAILDWLRGAGVKFVHLVHAPTPTSVESAAARGEPIEVGAKAMVVKAGERFVLLVLSAAKRIDSGAVKRHFAVKSVRFASAPELFELTGLVPGSVPPFGRPILDLPLYIDSGVADLPRVAFNAADLTESIKMPTADYLAMAKPEGTFTFAVSG